MMHRWFITTALVIAITSLASAQIRLRFVPAAVGVGDGGEEHAFFDEWRVRADNQVAWSFRPQAGVTACSSAPTFTTQSPYWELQLGPENQSPCNGLFARECTGHFPSTYSPGTDTDPEAQDALRTDIAAFIYPGSCPIAEGGDGDALVDPIDEDDTVLQVTNSAPYGPPRQLLLTDSGEVMNVVSRDTTADTITVTRAYGGTVATSHSAGAGVLISVNQTGNNIEPRISSLNGNTYYFTWDVYFTQSYIGAGAFNSGQKTFTFLGGNTGKLWEIRTRFTGAGPVTCTGFNSAIHVGCIDVRPYNAVNNNMPDQDTWAETDGDTMGPGITLASDAIVQQETFFIVWPSRWTRYWVKVEQRDNDWDLFSMWVADEETDATLLFDEIPMSVNQGGANHTLLQLNWEFGDSQAQWVRGHMNPMRTYNRNFLMHVWSTGSVPDLVAAGFFARPVGTD